MALPSLVRNYVAQSWNRCSKVSSLTNIPLDPQFVLAQLIQWGVCCVVQSGITEQPDGVPVSPSTAVGQTSSLSHVLMFPAQRPSCRGFSIRDVAPGGWSCYCGVEASDVPSSLYNALQVHLCPIWHRSFLLYSNAVVLKMVEAREGGGEEDGACGVLVLLDDGMLGLLCVGSSDERAQQLQQHVLQVSARHAPIKWRQMECRGGEFPAPWSQGATSHRPWSYDPEFLRCGTWKPVTEELLGQFGFVRIVGWAGGWVGRWVGGQAGGWVGEHWRERESVCVCARACACMYVSDMIA
jgi:hypothetical protein